MLTAVSPSTHFTTRLVASAAFIAQDLKRANRISRQILNAAMFQAFAGTAASGAWTRRDSFVAAEIALILSL